MCLPAAQAKAQIVEVARYRTAAPATSCVWCGWRAESRLSAAHATACAYLSVLRKKRPTAYHAYPFRSLGYFGREGHAISATGLLRNNHQPRPFNVHDDLRIGGGEPRGRRVPVTEPDADHVRRNRQVSFWALHRRR